MSNFPPGRPRLRAVTPRAFRLLDETPRFVQAEDEAFEIGFERQKKGGRYLKSLRHETAIGAVEFRYRVTGWRTIDEYVEPGDIPAVRRKHLIGHFWQGPQKIGAMEVTAYQVASCVAHHEFFDIMDSRGHDEMTLADAICSSWRDLFEDLGQYGDFIEFKNLWVKHEFAKRGWWAPFAQEAVWKHFQQGAALFTLAFPLEFGGRVEPGTLDEDRFERRKDALQRYAKRLFQLRQLPGDPGKQGWLWRPSTTTIGKEPCRDPSTPARA